MEIRYFSLDSIEKKGFVKFVRIVFGIVCLGVAVFWLAFNLKQLKADKTLWITIFFLSGFGFYQIWAGAGKANRYIEIGPGFIRLKSNFFSPHIEMIVQEFEKIELYPLSVVFFLKGKKKKLLRFGTTYYESNRMIMDEIIDFADSNMIPYEIIQDEL
jgi:hypothetical protein